MSNSSEWVIYPEELARRSTDGISAVRSALKELEKAGYLISIRRSYGGRIGNEYFRFAADKKFPDLSREHFNKQIDDYQNDDYQNDDYQNDDYQNDDYQNDDYQNRTLTNTN